MRKENTFAEGQVSEYFLTMLVPNEEEIIKLNLCDKDGNKN